jgi:hypothetical protein
MDARMRRLLALTSALAVAACAYDPPVRADHQSARYQADLVACRKEGTAAADKRTVAYGYLFLSYPISYPIVRREEIRKCMQGRGYALSS